MDGTLYADHMPEFLEITDSLLKLFIWINKDIMCVDFERHR